jgi:hypothetical protein
MTAAVFGLIAAAGAQMPPPEALAGLRGVAADAARNCNFFLERANHVSIRSSQQGQALAAIRSLREASRRYADATVSAHWPRPDWLRYCSERLLDAWIGVDQTLPMLEAPPEVMAWWGRTQGALVALYNAAAPFMGRPSGGPLPMALGGGGPSARPPGVVREAVPVVPGGQPVVK